MSFLLFFIIFILSISFIFLNYVYYRISAYYRPLEYKDKKTGQIINVHSLYEPFHSIDKINYFKLILIGTFIYPIRFVLSLSCVIAITIHLNIAYIFYKNSDTDLNSRKKIKSIIYFWSSLCIKASGIEFKEQKISEGYEEIYKKYLGKDYDFTDQKYSLIISNHLGIFDVIANMCIHGPGFIAKAAVSNYPFFGGVGRALHCLFVNREDEGSRKNILDRIHEKQVNFYEGKNYAPLALFPEGTTTNGRYLLKFKKGAFYSLLPVKPTLIKYDQNIWPHIAIGGQNIFFHTHRVLSSIKLKMFYINLPVIRPTQYMFENYANLGKEKWEIFAEVARKICCEIGGFKESELGYRDSITYSNAMIKGLYNPDDIIKKNI